MNCCAAIQKYLLSYFSPADRPVQSPVFPRSEPLPHNPAKEVTPCMFSVESKEAPTLVEEDEDFFKDLAPTYVAPKTVSLKTAAPAVSTRFAMEATAAADWGSVDF